MYTSIFTAGGKDFERIDNKILVFDQNSMEHKVPIEIYDNVIDEESKEFNVQLNLISGVRTRLTPSVMTVTITEDDIDDTVPRKKYLYL